MISVPVMDGLISYMVETIQTLKMRGKEHSTSRLLDTDRLSIETHCLHYQVVE